MSPDTLPLLLWTAATLGFVHTLIGVDHSVPFVVLGRSQRWSLRKTLSITALCGMGHVLGSVLIGTVGIGLGVALERMQWIEGLRGSIASWLLIGFGLAYATWGLVQAARGRVHRHPHAHADGTLHDHNHEHSREHLHAHVASNQPGLSEQQAKTALTAWTLFVIFAFGPCEALIPLLMVPALALNWWAVAAVTALFGVVTIATMLGAVWLGYLGLRLPTFGHLERHLHTVAGLTIAGSGLAIQLLGI